MSTYELAEAAYNRRLLVDSMSIGHDSVVDAALSIVDLLRIHTRWPKDKWRLKDYERPDGTTVKVTIEPAASRKELEATAKVGVEYTIDGKRWFSMEFTVKRDARADGEWWQIGEDYVGAIHFRDEASIKDMIRSKGEDMVKEARDHDL